MLNEKLLQFAPHNRTVQHLSEEKENATGALRLASKKATNAHLRHLQDADANVMC